MDRRNGPFRVVTAKNAKIELVHGHRAMFKPPGGIWQSGGPGFVPFNNAAIARDTTMDHPSVMFPLKGNMLRRWHDRKMQLEPVLLNDSLLGPKCSKCCTLKINLGHDLKGALGQIMA